MPNPDTSEQLPAPKADPVAAKIDAWFYREFSDTPVSRDTALWEMLFAAKDRLKADLAAE